MLHERELRRQLQLFVDSEVSLREFNRWLVGASWDMFSDGSSESAKHMASEIQMRIAEFGENDIEEAELRRELENL